MMEYLRPFLTRAGEVLPDDPAVHGLLLVTTGILSLSNLVTLWKWWRAPVQKDRVRISVDQPAGQSVRITTGE